MAIILKKDVGLGEMVEAYVSFEIEWSTLENGRWKIDVTTWPSKKAREVALLREWIDYRMSDVKVKVPLNEQIANEFGIPLDIWDEATEPGPWDNAEDLKQIRMYANMFTRPIQESSYYFYDDRNVKGLPSKISPKSIKKDFYKAVKDENSELFNCIRTGWADKTEIAKSIKDDLETKKEVILRYAKKDPLLTVLAPSESVLMWPDGWS